MTTKQDDPTKQLYRATPIPRLVWVPAMPFLSIDGQGDPNTGPMFADAVQALYSVTYAAKFAIKRAHGANLKVAPLESLWWATDMITFTTGHKEDWNWTAMIRQPDLATDDLIGRVITEVRAKKSLPLIGELRLATFEEGPAAQVLHVGPYAAEAPTISRLHAFIHDQGFDFDGRRHKHHEIYLSDPRRTAPNRLRTIIRQPYAP